MLLSNQWLQEFVELEISPHDFAESMSLSGSKVEGWEDQRDAISNVVVGRIDSIEKHPNADRLQVCHMDVDGGRTPTVLTAATNVMAGQLVPVALDGAVLPGGHVIRAGKMRGLMSEGMLCSYKELGLTLNDVPYADEDGILILTEIPCSPGDDIRDVFRINDIVYEFEITPNRPDCLSVRGLAREAAATFGKRAVFPAPQVRGGGGDVRGHLSIKVESPELCPRYSARVVKDVKVGMSPLWLRARLRASGIRPINNIVDVTNYVLLEYGQPMHAFDHSCLDGGQIVVRTAREGESMFTLDGQERKLTPNMLVIADAHKPVCVAGVMGGANSEITDLTKTIVLESANFSGSSVRKTALQLAMRTDASSRFEKGLDTENTIPALERACELIEQLGAGTVLDGVIDVDSSVRQKRRIPIEPDKINAFLGSDIPQEDMEDYLRALCFEVENGMAEPPSFRPDVSCPADLAEEVARLYGYNRIPSSLPSGGAMAGSLTPRQKLRLKVAQTCRTSGFDETLSYSFISPSDYDRIRLPGSHALRDSVKLLNPLGEDKSVMRTTTLPSIISALAGNVAARNPDTRLYELGLVFHKTGEKLPDEKLTISLGAYGDGFDFYALKGVVEAIVSDFYIIDYRFVPCSDSPAFHPGRCAEIIVDGKTAGILGELHPDVLEKYGFDDRAWVAELSFDLLFELRGDEPRYTPLPRFPSIRRDIALLCDRAIQSDSLISCIRSACSKLLESCALFDVYTGDRIPGDKKSVAYKLVFRAHDRTLTDAEADAQMKRVTKALEKEYSAVLRS